MNAQPVGVVIAGTLLATAMSLLTPPRVSGCAAATNDPLDARIAIAASRAYASMDTVAGTEASGGTDASRRREASKGAGSPAGVNAAPATNTPQGTSAPTGRNAPARTVAPDTIEGAQLFVQQIAPVLLYPRCLNCHPRGDFPRQGNERRRHDFGVTRGKNDRGAPGLRCNTCHQASNQDASGVPGALNWHLAPLAMAWEGLTVGELCRTITDRTRNGNRDAAALAEHMTNDHLVHWGWNPGGQRTPVPTPQADFVAAVEKWAAVGAPCPQ